MKTYLLKMVPAALLFAALFMAACEKGGGSSSNDSSSNGDGKSGSTARFAIANNHLYTVDEKLLHVFNIENPANPVELGVFEIGEDIETIFGKGENLFIGSQIGVTVINVSNPNQPVRITEVQHIYSCDPVVADSDYAFVTLRSDNFRCGRSTNELQVINIKNLNAAYIAKTYPMSAPKGLGIDSSFLFVCDNGIKMYDKSQPLALSLLDEVAETKAVDLIAYKGNLVVTATDGIAQYGYANGKLQLRSKIYLPLKQVK